MSFHVVQEVATQLNQLWKILYHRAPIFGLFCAFRNLNEELNTNHDAAALLLRPLRNPSMVPEVRLNVAVGFLERKLQ